MVQAMQLVPRPALTSVRRGNGLIVEYQQMGQQRGQHHPAMAAAKAVTVGHAQACSRVLTGRMLLTAAATHSCRSDLRSLSQVQAATTLCEW